jgi:hypothetical protein
MNWLRTVIYGAVATLVAKLAFPVIENKDEQVAPATPAAPNEPDDGAKETMSSAAISATPTNDGGAAPVPVSGWEAIGPAVVRRRKSVDTECDCSPIQPPRLAPIPVSGWEAIGPAVVRRRKSVDTECDCSPIQPPRLAPLDWLPVTVQSTRS